MESRQAAALYPVGRVLRATYDAENHDSLGTDITGLMLELAHIDPDAPTPAKVAASAAPVARPFAPEPLPVAVAPVSTRPEPVSWWRVAWGRLLAR